MEAVEIAAGIGGLLLLIRLVPWAWRAFTEIDREIKRRIRRDRQRADADVEGLLLGPYLTTSDHHDFIADRWSVIADAAVVVGLEQSVRRVQSGGRDDVA